MHNEFDANTPGVTTRQWVAAVQADAALVRGVLGQGAATTPYAFTYGTTPSRPPAAWRRSRPG